MEDTDKINKNMLIAGVCGVIGPIIALLSIMIAVIGSLSWFTWSGNWLSDLGGFPGKRPIWTSHGMVSIVFNGGLILAGIIGIIFGISLKKSQIFVTWRGNLGIFIFIMAMVALCLVGIFPQTLGYLHLLGALPFFFLSPIALILLGLELKKSSEVFFGKIITIAGIISFCAFPFLFVPRPWGSNAIVEMIPSLSLSIFCIGLGIKLIYRVKYKNEKGLSK
jgi:hypothetical membrane protein